LIPNLVYLEVAQVSVIIFVNEITKRYFQVITIPHYVDLQVTSVEAAGTNIKKFCYHHEKRIKLTFLTA